MSQRTARIIFVCASLLFVGTILWYATSAGQHFASPDETVNYFGTKNIAAQWTTGKEDAVSREFPSIIPRSTILQNGAVYPATFFGLPILYGALVAVAGEWLLPLLPAFLFAAAGLALFSIWKRLFSVAIAAIATFAFFVHPAMWYFSAKGYWHNALFLFLLIFFAWFITTGVFKKKRISRYVVFFAGGISLGLAVGVRTSEVLWVGAATLIAGYSIRHLLSWSLVGLCVFGGIVGFVPVLIMNTVVFGHPLSFAYGVTESDIVVSGIQNSGGVFWSQVLGLLTPFWNSWSIFFGNLHRYTISFFPIFISFSLIGFFYSFFAEQKILQHYRRVSLLVILWLVMYYAGGEFLGSSRTNSEAIVGSSFLRYWLPLFTVALPFFAIGILEIARRLFRKNGFLFVQCICGLFVFFSVSNVWNDPLTGLKKFLTDDAQRAKGDISILRETIPDNAVIIAGQKDKMYFPEYRVLGYSRFDESLLRDVPQLVESIPVYYTTFSDVEKKRVETFLASKDLTLRFVTFLGRDPLYSVVSNVDSITQ